MLALVFFVLALANFTISRRVEYDWSIGWENRSPDGFARPVIAINGQWPLPQLDIDVGDYLVVNVYNDLGNQSTGIHWHGQNQRGSGTMDGPGGVTQCPIPPGSRMTYSFTVDKPGTYWYHSHVQGQYPDGLRGALIVHDPNPPFKFDREFTLTMSDWNHDQMPFLLNEYQSLANQNATGGLEPIPDAALFNDGKNQSIYVEPGLTYFVHMINVGNFAGFAIYFDGHPFTVVEVDGVYVEETYIGDQNVRIATGQRWGVLIHTKNDTSKNFEIFGTLDINMFTPPPGFNPNVTAYLVYNEEQPMPPPLTLYSFDFFDDLVLVPYDRQEILGPVDHQIILNGNSANINGIHRFTVNNVTYLPQKVPSLYTALSVGSYNTNPVVYGYNANPFVLKYNEVVEVIINNYHTNLHPWHIHGHQYQVLARNGPQEGVFNGSYGNYSSTPMRRDTIMLNKGPSHTILRFRADNPDKSSLSALVMTLADFPSRVWLVHCHVEWHVAAGLVATFIEAPDHINYTIPSDHVKVCKKYGMQTQGNAAANTRDPLNVTGQVDTVESQNHGAMYPNENGSTYVKRHLNQFKRMSDPLW